KIELNCLAGSLQPLADASQQPILAELRRSLMLLRERLSELPASLVAERLRLFEQRLAADLAEDLLRLREVSTPKPIQLSELPADFRSRYVGQSGKWLLRVFARD